MGDIDSVTGVHLVQLENRQLKIEKLKKYIYLFIFNLFILLGGMAKKKIMIFSEHLTNSRFYTILTSQLENVVTT